MESISEIYLNHFGSLDSRNRVEYELHAISRMLNITGIDEIDWSKFSRGDILSIAASAGFRAKRPNSQNFTLRILKGLCKEAYLAGLLPESRYLAIADIRTVRGERKSQRRVPGHSEILNILKNCDDDPIGIRDAAIISVAVGCGLRRTEITDLKCTDVDLERQELRIIGKGNKERYVFFCDAVSERLRAWHNLRGDDGASFFFVPVHKTGRLLAERHMSDETVYQMFFQIRYRLTTSVAHSHRSSSTTTSTLTRSALPWATATFAPRRFTTSAMKWSVCGESAAFGFCSRIVVELLPLDLEQSCLSILSSRSNSKTICQYCRLSKGRFEYLCGAAHERVHGSKIDKLAFPIIDGLHYSEN